MKIQDLMAINERPRLGEVEVNVWGRKSQHQNGGQNNRSAGHDFQDQHIYACFALRPSLTFLVSPVAIAQHLPI